VRSASLLVCTHAPSSLAILARLHPRDLGHMSGQVHPATGPLARRSASMRGRRLHRSSGVISPLERVRSGPSCWRLAAEALGWRRHAGAAARSLRSGDRPQHGGCEQHPPSELHSAAFIASTRFPRRLPAAGRKNIYIDRRPPGSHAQAPRADHRRASRNTRLNAIDAIRDRADRAPLFRRRKCQLSEAGNSKCKAL